MQNNTHWAAAAFAVACLAAACGGSDSPTSPSTGGGSGGGSSTTNTITLTSSGASPRDITVSVGSTVTFVNNDSGPHDMDSDPHPEHTLCPQLNVGFLSGGQSRTSQNLNTARVCTYHDHNQPSNTAFQGTIRIQ
jgi:plastocyanin